MERVGVRVTHLSFHKAPPLATLFRQRPDPHSIIPISEIIGLFTLVHYRPFISNQLTKYPELLLLTLEGIVHHPF
jgi:hypothetical protein